MNKHQKLDEIKEFINSYNDATLLTKLKNHLDKRIKDLQIWKSLLDYYKEPGFEDLDKNGVEYFFTLDSRLVDHNKELINEIQEKYTDNVEFTLSEYVFMAESRHYRILKQVKKEVFCKLAYPILLKKNEEFKVWTPLKSSKIENLIKTGISYE